MNCFLLWVWHTVRRPWIQMRRPCPTDYGYNETTFPSFFLFFSFFPLLSPSRFFPLPPCPFLFFHCRTYSDALNVYPHETPMKNVPSHEQQFLPAPCPFACLPPTPSSVVEPAPAKPVETAQTLTNTSAQTIADASASITAETSAETSTSARSCLWERRIRHGFRTRPLQ